jgi:hypothetical protein
MIFFGQGKSSSSPFLWNASCRSFVFSQKESTLVLAAVLTIIKSISWTKLYSGVSFCRKMLLTNQDRKLLADVNEEASDGTNKAQADFTVLPSISLFPGRRGNRSDYIAANVSGFSASSVI